MDNDTIFEHSIQAPRHITPRQPTQARNRKTLRQHLATHTRALSFCACAVLPALGAAVYEYGIAADQYVSSFKFIVQQQAPQTAAPESLLTSLSGGNPMLAMIENSEITVQYIGSAQILEDLHSQLPLDAIYATQKADRFSRLTPHLPRERQLLYWRRMVHPYFDLSSGIVTVDVRAFTPEDADYVAREVLSATQALVNQMSNTARQNALSYAGQTASAAQAKLQDDESALALYRNRYSVLFPEMSAESSTSVGTILSQQLNNDEANLATLQSLGQNSSSPQVQMLRARIAATQQQIATLNAKLAAANNGQAESLASVLSGYDTLMQTEQLDAQLYTSDLLALQNARNAAAEKAIYLESFVQPEPAQSSAYPERWLVIAETALAGFIVWILLTLVVNILRDQLD